MSRASSDGPLVVVGDAPLDRDLLGRVERLCPDAPVPVVDEVATNSRPGGAGLAALLAALDGRQVQLVTALGDDAAGHELTGLLVAAGVAVVDLGLPGATPEKLRVRSDGHSLLRVDRGGTAPGRLGTAGARAYVAASAAIAAAGAVLVSDYGRGVTAEAALRTAIGALPHRTSVVWDPHPRGPEPVVGAALVTPNEAEARHFAPDVNGSGLAATTARARVLAQRWQATAIAVTRGALGALVVAGDAPPLVVPAPPVTALDACGAGDRFAASAAGLLSDGALFSEAVAGAVIAASSYVANGGPAGLPANARQPAEDTATAEQTARQVANRVRARGGSLVAAGGCFDLLHAGHVDLLRHARALGDALVVCLNSDASIRRLKGPDRPVVPQHDRAAVLTALGCVDAVAIFDEDTPEVLLRQLRPDVFAKGGDYALTTIPEATVLAGWGGQAVVLPYLAGRSSTAMIEEAARRAQ